MSDIISDSNSDITDTHPLVHSKSLILDLSKDVDNQLMKNLLRHTIDTGQHLPLLEDLYLLNCRDDDPYYENFLRK